MVVLATSQAPGHPQTIVLELHMDDGTSDQYYFWHQSRSLRTSQDFINATDGLNAALKQQLPLSPGQTCHGICNRLHKQAPLNSSPAAQTPRTWR